MGLLDFLSMADNYEERKVERYQEGDVFVSTAAVDDSSYPFETAVAHPEYNDGAIVIVENYDDRASAETGHNRWVKTMTADDLPDELVDIGGADIATMLDAVSEDDTWRRYKRNQAN